MIPFTAQLQLETLFVINEEGRLVTTREPYATPGPRFVLIRSTADVAWAVRSDVPGATVKQIHTFAQSERPIRDFRAEPTHAAAYQALIGGVAEHGPAFIFPDALPQASDVAFVHDVAQLERHFHGWRPDELPERSPILAVLEGDHAVSICFSARRATTAAEAGVETAGHLRGRGLAQRVTVAWAQAIRSSGMLPLYSTSLSNAASLSLADKLRLEPCANDWSLYA